MPTLTPAQIETEVLKRLPSSARPTSEPTFIIILGPVCSGKTTLRRQKYDHGSVLVDAAQLFIDLGGIDLDFPSSLEEPMEIIGAMVARIAVSEHMNIVTEVLGAKFEPVQELINAMRAAGYLIEIEGLEADLDTCLEREEGRTKDNISSYYAEQYQIRWLLAAASTTKT